METSPLDNFSPITLAELESKAGLMERMDHKYIVSKSELLLALNDWTDQFQVLQINNKRSFAYESCYFDGADLNSFYDHQHGRRKRFKVRTRHYLDSGICFVELKLKGVRNRTVKTRMPYYSDHCDQLDSQSLNFIQQSYYDNYGKHFPCELSPSLKTEFNRITLVANQRSERLTIDTSIRFSSQGDIYQVDPDLAIIETKSARRNSIADKLLRELNNRPVSSCSKYCVGLSLLGKVERYNTFLPAVRKLTANQEPLQLSAA